MSNALKVPSVLATLVALNAPVEREIQYAGETVTMHFKRLTAGQRVALAGHQRITIDPNAKKAQAGTIDVAIADLQRNRYLLVAFSACDASGAALFKSAAEVEALPEGLADALAAAAEEVTSEAPGTGNG